jgi:NAD(P)-dependent dehydrogenase (short-subunit alcohol dehydrogenase family)
VVEQIKKETGNDKVEFVHCDLSDWASVVKCADNIKSKNIPIHVLLNNAGIMAPEKYGECKQGIEMQMSSNHIGHFILTRELMPAIKMAGPGARIVPLTSLAHKQSTVGNMIFGKAGFDFENILKKEKYNPYWHYGHVCFKFTDQTVQVGKPVVCERIVQKTRSGWEN